MSESSAAGSIDLHAHATDHLAQSHWHGFRYRVGEMVGLDRAPSPGAPGRG